ncbi:MAG: glycerate kinase [Bacillaceae bacterium]
MKVVVVMDSFKGSVASLEAGEAVREGVLAAHPHAQVIVKPLADGGEGTVEALVKGTNGRFETVNVMGPIYEKVNATYGILGDKKTAVIEVAEAAGLTQVPLNKRNPLNTTTYGVGEMIKAAIYRGCRHFVIGLGGSATNDGGVGMLQSLGFRFLNKEGSEIGFGGKGLTEIEKIDCTNALPQLKECTFQVACDVKNPLYGDNGAAYVYGPQKGATPKMVITLDQGLRHFADVIKRELGKEIGNVPGAGAAGGLGAGFLAFLNGSLQSGIQLVMEHIQLEEDIKDADFVITGEGCLDGQTAMGKAVVGVANIAKGYPAKVIALAGATTAEATLINKVGIHGFFSIVNRPMTLEEAMNAQTTKDNLRLTALQLMRLF